MVLHRKNPDLRLQISVCEMLLTQGILREVIAYRYRFIKLLLDQIANTHGIKALTSIKMLLKACKRGPQSGIRKDIVLLNGIDVILEYMRKDVVVNGYLERKNESQCVGFELFCLFMIDAGSAPEMVESIFKSTLAQESMFLSLMTNDQNDKFHLAELQNNIYAYWMILTIIKAPLYSAIRCSQNFRLKMSWT